MSNLSLAFILSYFPIEGVVYFSQCLLIRLILFENTFEFFGEDVILLYEGRIGVLQLDALFADVDTLILQSLNGLLTFTQLLLEVVFSLEHVVYPLLVDCVHVPVLLELVELLVLPVVLDDLDGLVEGGEVHLE